MRSILVALVHAARTLYVRNVMVLAHAFACKTIMVIHILDVVRNVFKIPIVPPTKHVSIPNVKIPVWALAQ